jgi:deazaflavin-dependent oxidoreductase (nitroreductase family)
MRLIERAFSWAQVTLYRLTGGRIAGSFGGAPVLVLTTVGRRSGKRRTVPLIYATDGETMVLTAPPGPGGRRPAWLLNAVANPDVVVQVGRVRRAMVARLASLDERDRLWAQVVATYPKYEQHRAASAHETPLVVLSA